MQHHSRVFWPAINRFPTDCMACVREVNRDWLHINLPRNPGLISAWLHAQGSSRWHQLLYKKHTTHAPDDDDDGDYKLINPLIARLKPQSNGPSYGNTVIGTLAVDGWAGLLHLVQRGGDWAGPQPAPAPLRCTKCPAHPSTASVPTSYYSTWHYNCLWSLKG